MSTAENSFSEKELASLRRHGSALVIPVLLLGVIAGLFFFLDSRSILSWQHQTVLALALVFGLIFWLLPSVRYFTNRYVISSNRIVVHRGLTGREADKASWNEINGVSVSKSFLAVSGDIHLHREFGQDLVLTNVGNSKKLIRVIEAHLASRAKRRSN
ncbi:MAG: PH domain-containing protein [Actinomycetes bacterium]